MEVSNASVGGSLHISTEVIAKIARQGALEIPGVREISGGAGVKNLLGKVGAQRPVTVQITDGVAEITMVLMVDYGCKIPALCEKVQKSVKSSVQNMTGITVSKVNVTIAGVCTEAAAE